MKLREAAETDSRVTIPPDIDEQLAKAGADYLGQLMTLTGCELLLNNLLAAASKLTIAQDASLEDVASLSPELEAIIEALDIFTGGVEGIAGGIVSGALKSEATAHFDNAIATGKAEARSYLEGYGMGGVADLIEAVGESAIDSAEKGEDGQRALAGMIVAGMTAICPVCGLVFGAILAAGSGGWIPDPGKLSPKPNCMEWTQSVRDGIQQRINAGMPKPENFDRCLNDGTMQRVILGGMPCPAGCENYYHAFLNGKC